MPPRDEEVRTALEMIPIHILRRMIEERDINFTSRRSDELIDELLQEDWTNEDFNELKSRLADIQREKKPYGRYISEVEAIDPGLEEGPDHERVQSVLMMNESDLDDNNELIEEGFQVGEAGADSVVGTHWSESINYNLTPMNEIKKEQTLYETGFKVDFDEDVIFIDCNLPAKARSLRNKFQNLGIRTVDVGHENIANPRANTFVQEFVDELEGRLSERESQAALSGTASRRVLEVDLVNILVDEADLRDVKIGGRTDIMENPEVRRFVEEHDSRIVRLKGEFLFNNNWFRFVTGYTEGMGSVSVEKKGKVEERPDQVEEAFDFLYKSYREYFVDI